MKNGFVKSSPYFFMLINRSICSLIAALLLAATLLPAPLQDQANPAITPNPAKSAWFLLWIQELISWSRFMIYPVIFLVALFVLLPWLPTGSHLHKASWFPCELRLLSIITVLLAVAITLLTVIAMFFRGANWALLF